MTETLKTEGTHAKKAEERAAAQATKLAKQSDELREAIEEAEGRAQMARAEVCKEQELVVKYNWSCPEHTLVDGVVVDSWGLVECVVDLRKMTQRNTRSGTVRAVKYFYVPM